MSSIYKKLFKQTAIYGLSSVVGRVLNYLLVPLYTALFVPGEYGKVVDLYALSALITILLSHGMETTYFKFINDKKYNKESVGSSVLGSISLVSMAFLVLGVLFSHSIASYLDYPVNFIYWFIGILFFDAICVLPFAKLRVDNKATRYALLKLLNIVITVGLNILFIVLLPKFDKLPSVLSFFDSPKVESVFISNFIASLMIFLILLPVIFRTKIKLEKEVWKPLLIYALPITIAGISAVINETMDKRFLKIWGTSSSPEAEAGVYGAVYKLSIFITLMVQAYRMGLEPFYFSHQKEKNSERTYANLLKILSTVLGITFVFLMANAHWIKRLFLRDEAYWNGMSVIPIVVAAQIFLGIYLSLSIWYKLTGKTIYGAYISGVGAVVTILMNYFLIPEYSYYGAAWGTLGAYFIMCLLSWFLGRKHYDIPYQVGRISLLLLSSFGLGVLIFFYFGEQFFISNVLALLFLGIILVIERKVWIKFLK